MTLPEHAVVHAPQVTLLAQPSLVAPDHLPVAWQGESTGGERLVEFAERLRTASHANPAGRDTREFLRGMSSKANDSALEHATFSLLIEGISGALAHELQRRPCAFAITERSARHVDVSDMRFVVPPAMLGSEAIELAWRAQMCHALESYSTLVDQLMTRYAWVDDKTQRRRMAREGASGVLPNSLETKLVLSGSARLWRSWLSQHGHEHAELEGRRLAVAMRIELGTAAPAFFDDCEIHRAADRHEAVRIVAR